MKHQLLTFALAAVTVAVALAAGSYRRAALVGAGTAAFTAVGSMLAMGKVARRAAKPVQGAMLVMVIGFLVRILLVAAGTAVVARAGESIVAFVVAFFVPYFIFSAIEGAYLHALSRQAGPTA